MIDKITAIKDYHQQPWSKENTFRVTELYQALTPEEGSILATYAIELLDKQVKDKAEDILLNLACLTPGALRGYHQELINRQVFYPGILYREAGSQISQQLVDLLSNDEANVNHLLQALAWIGDEVAQQAFLRWRESPPPWSSQLYVPPVFYTQEAGWTLNSKGERQNLFYSQCYPLVKAEDEEDYLKSPVKVAETHEANCLWCDRPLTTLFDLDLTHPSLGFLNIEGSQIRIATCEVCMCYGFVYTNVDWEGKAEWSQHNQKPDYLPSSDEEWERLPTKLFSLNQHLRDPFNAAHQFIYISSSQIGGHPTWIQDFDYPSCLECRNPMNFIAQLDADDFHGEGILYAFLCKTCGMACTSYQAT